jgi:hypothetical protein
MGSGRGVCIVRCRCVLPNRMGRWKTILNSGFERGRVRMLKIIFMSMPTLDPD